MSFADWVAATGAEPRPVSLARWLEDHPQVRDEISDGWRDGFTAQTITDWLAAEHDVQFDALHVQGWLTNVVGRHG